MGGLLCGGVTETSPRAETAPQGPVDFNRSRPHQEVNDDGKCCSLSPYIRADCPLDLGVPMATGHVSNKDPRQSWATPSRKAPCLL